MIGNLNIANSNRKDTNIKFTKDQEIAVHNLLSFLHSLGMIRNILMLFVVLEVQVSFLNLKKMLSR